MIVTPEQEKHMRDVFTSIFSNKQDAKALNSSNTDLINALAETFQVSKDNVSEAYKFWVKATKKKSGKKKKADPADIGTVGIFVSALVKD